MARLLNYFLKGLVLLAPFAITVYVCVRVFATIDGWLGLPIPGAGFVATEREISALDPRELDGLRADDPSYQAFRAHLRSLPAPPEPPAQDQITPDQLRRQ